MQLCLIFNKCNGYRNFVVICVQEVLKLEKEIGYEFALRRVFKFFFEGGKKKEVSTKSRLMMKF